MFHVKQPPAPFPQRRYVRNHGTLCSRCHERPPVKGQRYCAECHAAVMREYRARKKQRQADMIAEISGIAANLSALAGQNETEDARP